MARCCNDFSRTDLLRRAAAEAGRGLPAIESGMPLPAGTGLDRRSFLAPHRRARARRLRRVVVPAASLRGGHRRRDRGRGRRRCSSPFSSTAAPTRSRCSSRRRPALPEAAPAAGAARQPPGSPSPRTAACAGTPRWPALAQLHAEGKVAVMAGVGYTGPDQSHFTSRHFWEVGATSEQLARAGSAATSTGAARPTTRCRDSRSTGACSPRSRRPRCPSPRSTAPTSTASGRATCGATSRADARRDRRARRLPTNGDAALEQATSAARQSARLRRQLLPFAPKNDQPGFASPVAVSEGRRRVPAAARRPGSDARRRPAGALRGALRPRDVRHARRPAAGARRRAEADRRQSARISARPRGARSRRPRGRPRLVGVRAGARRRTARTGPIMAPPAPAS